MIATAPPCDGLVVILHDQAIGLLSDLAYARKLVHTAYILGFGWEDGLNESFADRRDIIGTRARDHHHHRRDERHPERGKDIEIEYVLRSRDPSLHSEWRVLAVEDVRYTACGAAFLFLAYSITARTRPMKKGCGQGAGS